MADQENPETTPDAEPTAAAHMSPSARLTVAFSSSLITTLPSSFWTRPAMTFSARVRTTSLSDGKQMAPPVFVR